MKANLLSKLILLILFSAMRKLLLFPQRESPIRSIKHQIVLRRSFEFSDTCLFFKFVKNRYFKKS